MGFSTGAQIIMGRRNGEGNYSAIGIINTHNFIFLGVLSLMLFLVMQFLSPFLFEKIYTSADVYSANIEYLSTRSWGVFFALAMTAFNSFFIGTTNTKALTYSTLIMATVNIILDYGLIFGNFGLPELKVTGAALASVISEISACVFLALYTLSKVNTKKYGLLKFRGFEIEVVKRIFRIGGPVMGQNILALTAWFTFFTLIEKMGERELAISQMIKSIYMLMVVPIFGFNAATNTLVSNLIGQGNSNLVMPLIRKVIWLAILTNIVIVQSIVFFPEEIMSLFSEKQDFIVKALPSLQVISAAIFFLSVGGAFFSGVSGTGNTRVSLLIEIVSISVYLSFAFYIILDLQVPLEIAWCSEFVYFTLMGIISFLYLKSGKWKGKQV